MRQTMNLEIGFRWVQVLSLLLLAACSPRLGFNQAGSQDSSSYSQTTPTPTPAPPTVAEPPATGTPSEPPPPITPIPPIFKMEPLLWEAVNSASRAWSTFAFTLLAGDVHSLVQKVRDMNRFCPKYQVLSDEQKINAVAMLISAMVKFESNFDPLMRYRESTMGTDPITGQPVYSEGLLQLSYQDETGWSFCKFDWANDKKLAANDPKKSILDPYKNLNCGIRILSEQVDRTGRIVIDQGAYWAVIKDQGKYQKINEIAKLVKTLKFCN